MDDYELKYEEPEILVKRGIMSQQWYDNLNDNLNIKEDK